MPGNPNLPDPFFSPESSQDATPATSGEFTQVFASVPSASSRSGGQPLAFAPGGDDDLTRVFSTIPNTEPAAPSAAQTALGANEETLLFEQVHMPFSESAPKKSAPQVNALPVPPSPMPAANRPSEQSASEFTQIFTPLAPPPGFPPGLKPTPAAAIAPQGGEFTQFFSAISARESAGAKPAAPKPTQPLAQAPIPVTPAPPAYPSPQPSGEFTQLFQQALPSVERAPERQEPAPLAPLPAAPAPQPASTAPEPGSFTQMFQQIKPPTEQQAPRHVVPPTPVPATPPPLAEAGSFTQLFQQVQPPQASTPPPMSPPAVPPQPSAFAQQPVAPADAWPAFGPPAQQQGTFTDVFAARPEPRLQQPASAAPPQWPASQPASNDGGFTELFRSTRTPPQAPGNNGFGTPNTAHAWPADPPPSPAHGAHPTSGGEFTKLMNSLASPSTPGASSPAGSAPGAFGASLPTQQPSVQNDAFFGSALAGGGPAESSEFTRVMRGSAQREGSVASATPAAASPAPVLAAPPNKKGEPNENAPAKKSKLLVILLVVMNVILVLALILIGIVVMRHK